MTPLSSISPQRVPVVPKDSFWVHWQLPTSLCYLFIHQQSLPAPWETAQASCLHRWSCKKLNGSVSSVHCIPTRLLLFFKTSILRKTLYSYLWAFWNRWGFNTSSNPQQWGKEMNTPTSLSIGSNSKSREHPQPDWTPLPIEAPHLVLCTLQGLSPFPLTLTALSPVYPGIRPDKLPTPKSFL